MLSVRFFYASRKTYYLLDNTMQTVYMLCPNLDFVPIQIGIVSYYIQIRIWTLIIKFGHSIQLRLSFVVVLFFTVVTQRCTLRSELGCPNLDLDS